MTDHYPAAAAARPTDAFRAEHRELIAHIEHLRQAARLVRGLDRVARTDLIAQVLDFLTGTLLLHAQAEERVLYPEWARLVGYPDAAAPMVHDHGAIASRIHQLQEADVADTATLEELLYELHALVSVHFDKEEQIQLPAFDAQPQAYVDEVLARMVRTAGHRH